MNTDIAWWPQRCGPGDVAGRGLLKLLGRPHLELMEILIRETVQNSWDARIPGVQPWWDLHVRRLDDTAADVLRSQVFREPGMGTGLSALLAEPAIEVIEVSDRGTVGLGGPTRNDQHVPIGEPLDYIDFVLTVGAGQNAAGRGGTYGFGKVIAYLASRASTILIYSRTMERGAIESRLIGSAIGENFEIGRLRYTGRQWWGVRKDSTFAPVIGAQAELIGDAVFATPFLPDQTGTSILILGPRLDGEPLVIARDAAAAVMWNVWPKLLAHSGHSEAPMRLSVHADGEPVRLTDPLTDPRTKGYARALQAVRATQSGVAPLPNPFITTHSVTYYGTETGHLAIDRDLTGPATQDDPQAPYLGRPQHVALLRHDAELVVRYLEIPNPMPNVAASGVFRTTAAVDAAFAEAEPPTHDDWTPNTIQDRTRRGQVNTSLRKIKELWREALEPVAAVVANTGDSAVLVANDLAGLLTTAEGNRPGPQPPGPGGSSGPSARRPRAVVVGDRPLTQTSTELDVQIERPVIGYAVVAEAGIGYDGGTEDSDEVQVVSWGPGDGGQAVLGKKLHLDPGIPAKWAVLIHHPVGVALDASIRVIREDS